MVQVNGTFDALVAYVGPTRGKKTKDAILYAVADNISPTTVSEMLLDENLLWLLSDNVSESKFVGSFPKAVRVETIF